MRSRVDGGSSELHLKGTKGKRGGFLNTGTPPEFCGGGGLLSRTSEHRGADGGDSGLLSRTSEFGGDGGLLSRTSGLL